MKVTITVGSGRMFAFKASQESAREMKDLIECETREERTSFIDLSSFMEGPPEGAALWIKPKKVDSISVEVISNIASARLVTLPGSMPLGGKPN